MPKREWLHFEVARAYVRSFHLPNRKTWKQWSKEQRPKNIPSDPVSIYAEEWQGWEDWLGVEVTRQFFTFAEARAYVHQLHLKTSTEWFAWRDIRPLRLPANPHFTYKNEWTSWHDFLGAEQDT